MPVIEQTNLRDDYFRIQSNYGCELGGHCNSAYQRIKNAGTLSVCRLEAFLFNDTGATGGVHLALVDASLTALFGSTGAVDVATLPTGTGICTGGTTPGAACFVGGSCGGGTCDVGQPTGYTAFTFPNDVVMSGDFVLVALPDATTNIVRWAQRASHNAYEDASYDGFNPLVGGSTGQDYAFRIFARVPGTPAPTATSTSTPTVAVPTATVTATLLATITATPIQTVTPTPLASATTTPLGTVTATPVSTGTATPTPTRTATPLATTTATATIVAATPTPTFPAPSPTATSGSAGSCAAPIILPPDGGTFTGTTVGTGSLSGSCALSNPAPENVFSWTAPRNGIAVIDTCGGTTSYDTVLYVRNGTCAGNEPNCSDDAVGCTTSEPSDLHGSSLTITVTAGETYVIVVDGYSDRKGDFSLHVLPPS